MTLMTELIYCMNFSFYFLQLITALATCLYINYFDQVDRDGLGSTESILRKKNILYILTYVSTVSSN